MRLFAISWIFGAALTLGTISQAPLCATCPTHIILSSAESMKQTEDLIKKMAKLTYEFELQFGNFKEVLASKALVTFANTCGIDRAEYQNLYNDLGNKFANSLIGYLEQMNRHYVHECRALFWQLSEEVIKDTTRELLDAYQPTPGSKIGDYGQVIAHIEQKIREKVISCCK